MQRPTRPSTVQLPRPGGASSLPALRSNLRTAPSSLGRKRATTAPGGSRGVTFDSGGGGGGGGGRLGNSGGLMGGLVGTLDVQEVQHFLQELRSGQRQMAPDEATSSLLGTCEMVIDEYDKVLHELVATKSNLDRAAEENEQFQTSLNSTQRLLNLFEKLNFVMDMMDVKDLESSISEIEGTTSRYDATFDSEYPPREAPTIPRNISDTEKVFFLVQRKFKALEDLIFVLKKRVLTLENNEDLAESLKAFGSVRNLLDENTRLRKENERLKTREQRFLHEPLLKRRNLRGYDVNQLQMLVVALQNELGFAMSILDEHNLAHFVDPKVRDQSSVVAAVSAGNNARSAAVAQQQQQQGGNGDGYAITSSASAFGPLVNNNNNNSNNNNNVGTVTTPRGGFSLNHQQHTASSVELLDIDELFSYNLRSAPAASPEPQMSEAARAHQLEHENANLKERVRQLEAERAIRRNLEDITHEFISAMAGTGPLGEASVHVIKEKKLAKVTKLATDQAVALEKVSVALANKTEECNLAQDVVKGLQTTKAKLVSDNMRVSKWCTGLLNEKEQARSAIVALQQRSEGIIGLGKALALSLLVNEDENEDPASSSSNSNNTAGAAPPAAPPAPALSSSTKTEFVGQLYRDFVAAYASAAGAATAIQRVLRGHMSRQANPLPKKEILGSHPPRPSSSSSHRSASRSSQSSSVPAYNNNNNANRRPPIRLLPHLVPLVEMILRSGRDLEDVATIRHSLVIAKEQIAVRLKAEVQASLGEMRGDLSQTSKMIEESVQRLAAKPQNHVAVQAHVKMRHNACQYFVEEEETPVAKGKKK